MNKTQFNALLKKHGADELANSVVFPVKLRGKQKKEAGMALAKELTERRMIISDKDKLKMNLMQIRFQIEDYINDKKFDKNKSFGYFLKTYITGLGKKNVEFAGEINIKPAELSQYINDHRTPPQNIIIRLELHSRNFIPAVNWYRILEKKTLHELNTNIALRKAQKQFVNIESRIR